MMNLYFLRHGLAVEFGTPGYPDDALRPLTPEGERKVRQIAKGIEALGVEFELILSSPYLRARQTAEIVAAELGAGRRLRFSTALVPGASSQDLIDELVHLDPLPEEVVLVGHEPNLSRLISLLLSGKPEISVTMKKSGLCKLEVELLKKGRCASLEWLLTPKQMMLMGKSD